MQALIPTILIAQAATCGLYGTPSSPGGCSLPASDGGAYYLQNTNGQLYIQERRPQIQFNPHPSLELQPIQRH
jgi:hypothetical protein